jgi:hypothetical protein
MHAKPTNGANRGNSAAGGTKVSGNSLNSHRRPDFSKNSEA